MGKMILWGFIVLILFIAYRKADKTVKHMEEVAEKQKMEHEDPKEDV